MTDRTINLKEAADIVRHECGEWTGLAETIIRRLKEMPTVDAVPVVHGRWIQVSQDRANCNRCNCESGKMIKQGERYFPKFCPECGAKMDGKGNGNETD